MINSKIAVYYNAIVEMLEIEGAKFEFVDVVIDLEDIYEPFATSLKKKAIALKKEIDTLRIKYCIKDNEGNPIIHTKNLPDGSVFTRYEGLATGQNTDFDTRYNELEKASINLNDEETEISTDKFEKIKRIKLEQCPSASMKGKHWKVIRQFIDK